MILHVPAGVNKMKNNVQILVCYATRYGSTKEVAEIIGEQLSDLGYNVRISDLMRKIDLSGIDAVFIGSPLHLGKWLPEAKEFLQFRKSELNKIPVIAFTTGITLASPTEHNLLKARFAIDEISVHVTPVDTGFFAGRISLETLSDTDIQLVKLAGIKDGDYIDSERIKEWVIEVCKNITKEKEKQNISD